MKKSTSTPALKIIAIPAAELGASFRAPPPPPGAANLPHVESAAATSVLHQWYEIHWRTEITPAHIELIGHVDYHAPTPEAAVEKFQNDFPGREITRAVAL